MNKHEYLIIDGMALLFRHYFATAFKQQFMKNSDDVPTNAVQGVVRHVFKLIEMTQPKHVIVVWDLGAKTIRNEWFSDYKKNRDAPPKELIPQFDTVKEVLNTLGFYQLGSPGFEADDVIGTLLKHLNNATVVTGDRDILQTLADGNANEIWLIKKGFTEYDTYDYETFVFTYTITPSQYIDVKALMGDTSDGYRGVAGIGEKTAFKLIREHEHIEGLIRNLDTLSPSVSRKIMDDFESLEMSLKLATIITHVPIDVERVKQESTFQVNVNQAKDILNAFELRIASRYLDSLVGLHDD